MISISQVKSLVRETCKKMGSKFASEDAINLGANLLVIGRTITESKNPLKTIKEINKSIN